MERLRICRAIFQKGKEHIGDLEIPQCLQLIIDSALPEMLAISIYVLPSLQKKKKKGLAGFWSVTSTNDSFPA